MAANSNETNLAYIYKRRYSDDQVSDASMRDQTVLKMIEKRDGFTGVNDKYTYAVRYGNPQGISGTFASAQDNNSSSKGKQFEAVRRDGYGIVQITGPAMRAAKDDRGAFLDVVTQEPDGTLEELGDALSHQLWGDGNGYLGRRASISTNTVTLGAGEARNFKVGMTVVADNDIAGGSLRSGNTTVDKVNEDDDKNKPASAAGITSFADNDYLFRIGDPGTIIDGFESHIPLTAPVSGTLFRGVERTDHLRILAGIRVDDTTTTIVENAGLCAVRIRETSSTAGNKKKILALSPVNFWAVSRELNAKVTYDGGGVKATAMFEGFDIASPAGVLRAVSDPHCPPNRGRLLALDTWYWKTLDPWVHVIRDDKGGPALRVYNADAIEIRMRHMGNLCCTLPGANAVFNI